MSLRTHSDSRNPFLLIRLLHVSLYTPGVGIGSRIGLVSNRFTAKSLGIRTYEKHTRNPIGMNSSKTKHLKGDCVFDKVGGIMGDRDRAEIDWITPIVPGGPLGEARTVLLEPTNRELEMLNQGKCTCLSYRTLDTQNKRVLEQRAEDEQDSRHIRQETESL